MPLLPLLLTATVSWLCLVNAHTYHLGSCPTVQPMESFDMSRFLGKWYVVQKTSTASTCMTNVYAANNTGGTGAGYVLEQRSQNPLLGLTRVQHVYRYTGRLYVRSPRDAPAAMEVDFPLNPAGTATYTVLDTDYSHYGVVFTCQSLAFAHRQSASILSRSPTLSAEFVEKARDLLAASHVDPYDLSIISHDDCPGEDGGVDIDINPNTFSASNIADVVRAAGGKLGDGIEAAAGGVRTLYDTLNGGESGAGSRDREELSDVSATTDTEWLP